MSFLRGSANYVWCTTSVLGKGATGAVYQGVNKVNGEPVAVKTFNQLSHMRPQDVQVREFEVLKKVKHENIVKLLAIEEEQQEGRGKVIVMELCTGGSLFNILDDPENTYGLEENEFILVLDHLTAGMKHLRDNNLVHRDLKPGNIMKFIRDDATTVYKLTDFGAARELQEGQHFVSLYGTEEYLHPDMYERAVLRKPVGKTFGATVDLWSIGVTLYHVATGNLPFRPYGGRRNKETMFHITTKKASGVISGIQTKDNGPIEWGRDLPNSCQLSTGLKKTVTPLLAGLLEADPKKIWTFDRFFANVTECLSRKVVYIFHVNRATNIKVYMHPDETYEQLQNYIMDQTEITPEVQILLYKNQLFVDVVGDNRRGLGYPETHEDGLLLFSSENNNVTSSIDTEIPKFPEFHNLVSVENDAAQAKIVSSLGHLCKRRIEKISTCSIFIEQSVNSFTEYLMEQLKELERLCKYLSEITESRKQTVNVFHIAKTSSKVFFNINEKQLSENNNKNEVSLLCEDFFNETCPKVKQLYNRNVTENILKLEWESSNRSIKNPAKTRSAERAKTLVERLRDSWQHLVRDRATRSLSYNDEQFHLLERIKITETGRRIKSLFESECLPSFTQLADALSDWYKIAQTVYLQTMILQKDVDLYQKKLEDLSENLTLDIIEYNDDVKSRISQIKAPQNVTKNVNAISSKKFKMSIQEAEKCKTELYNLVQENNDLISTFKELCVKKFSTN